MCFKVIQKRKDRRGFLPATAKEKRAKEEEKQHRKRRLSLTGVTTTKSMAGTARRSLHAEPSVDSKETSRTEITQVTPADNDDESEQT